MRTKEFFYAVASILKSEPKIDVLEMYTQYLQEEKIPVEGSEADRLAEIEHMLTNAKLGEVPEAERLLTWYYLNKVVHPIGLPMEAPPAHEEKLQSSTVPMPEQPGFIAIVAHDQRVIGILPHTKFRQHLDRIIVSYFGWLYNAEVTVVHNSLYQEDDKGLKLYIIKKNGIEFYESFTFQFIEYMGYQDSQLFFQFPF